MSLPKKDALYVQSVEKAFKVLSVFNAKQSALSLVQVSQLTGHSKSSAQRFCYTLEKLGYLTRVKHNSAYELTAKTTEIGACFIESNNLVRRARPYLHTLSIKTDGATTLSILDDNEIIFVSRFLGKEVLETTVTVGSRLPIYCTASGRAAASLLTEPELDEVLAAQSWQQRTAKTQVDRAQVKALIMQTKESGYALVEDQYVLADLSLAVPIYDSASNIKGAINLALTNTKHTKEQLLSNYLGLMQNTARMISS